MKNHFHTSEKFILITICLIFILAAGGIFISVQNYTPPEPAQQSAIMYGKEEAYLETTRLIREERDALLRMMELAGPISDYIGDEDALQSHPELGKLMQDHGIKSIYRDKKMWTFDTHFSGGIVTSSVDYQILFTAADPRNLVTTWNDENTPWIQLGDGWAQEGGNVAYIEEIAENFYYFFLST